jgi:hypothetical protein
MGTRRDLGSRAADFRGLIVPLIIAAVLTLAYFAVSNGWQRLANPIPGLIAVAAGCIGAAAGIFIARIRRRGASAQSADHAG